jgi:hypothetical protein
MAAESVDDICVNASLSKSLLLKAGPAKRESRSRRQWVIECAGAAA